MENRLQHSRVEPRDLTFRKLEDITSNFSQEHKVGSGGFGDVYKGVLDDGTEIAIKKLHPILGLDSKQFKNEFNSLMRVKHKNIIRLVAYCYEIRHKHIKDDNGQFNFAKMEERALCFEYFQRGSLDKYLSDESCRFAWHTWYKIIKGTCEGLDYLHNGPHDPIFHLDIKPGNILLDDNMMPQIADFGLSKLLRSIETHTTKVTIGTRGYMPPEYIDARRVSPKFDVFSLGVIIIEILAKHLGYSSGDEISPKEFIGNVQAGDNLKKRMQAICCNLQEVDILEVQTCMEIALRCVEFERAKRPTIREIVDKLNEIEAVRKSLIAQSSECKLERLVIDPLELRFPLGLDRQQDDDVHCILQLTNKSDDFMAFIVKTNQSRYSTRPDRGVMKPWSKQYVVVTTTLQSPDSCMQCEDLFLVRTSQCRPDLTSDDVNLAEDFEKTMMMMDKAVDEVRLPVVYVELPPPRT